MSKIYNLYKNLKSENKENICLFKSGIFFIAIADDAILLANKFNFKLTKLNDSIVKCGFPTSSLEKYQDLFSCNNINYKIIDSSSNTIYSQNEFKLNNDVQNLIKLICSVDTDNLSVGEIYAFVESIQKKAKNLYLNL